MSLYRKKFGWLTFAVNLLSYFAFLIPLTSLAVYGHMNEGTLCIKDNSTESGYEVSILYSSFRRLFIDVRESDGVAWWWLREGALEKYTFGRLKYLVAALMVLLDTL